VSAAAGEADKTTATPGGAAVLPGYFFSSTLTELMQ